MHIIQRGSQISHKSKISTIHNAGGIKRQSLGNQLQFEEVTQSYQQNTFHKNSIGSLKVCNPEVLHILFV